MDILLCFPISSRARFFHSTFLPLSQFCTLPSSNGFQCERDLPSPPLLLCHPTSHPCSESGSLLGSGPTPPRACWHFHLDALPSHQIPHLFNLWLNLPLHPQSWFSFLVFVPFFQPSWWELRMIFDVSLESFIVGSKCHWFPALPPYPQCSLYLLFLFSSFHHLLIGYIDGAPFMCHCNV